MGGIEGGQRVSFGNMLSERIRALLTSALRFLKAEVALLT